MKCRSHLFAALSLFAAPVSAQSVLFDFNDAPLHSPRCAPSGARELRALTIP